MSASTSAAAAMEASSSSSSLAPQRQALPSSSSSMASATRARTRSVGVDAAKAYYAAMQDDDEEEEGADAGPSNRHVQHMMMERGRNLMTPDFTIQKKQQRTSLRESRMRSGSSSAALQAIGRGPGESSQSQSQSQSQQSSSSNDAASGPKRPRLSNPLRSFISSFSGAVPGTSSSTHTNEDSTTTTTTAKARSSGEFEQPSASVVGGPAATERFQGLGASAVSLASATAPVSVSAPVVRTSAPLAMPAARQAGPDGLRGLNDDSPPLTPTSEREGLEDNYTYPPTAKQYSQLMMMSSSSSNGIPSTLSSTWTAAADSAARLWPWPHHLQRSWTNSADSSATSGRSSPLFSASSLGSGSGNRSSDEDITSPTTSPDEWHTAFKAQNQSHGTPRTMLGLITILAAKLSSSMTTPTMPPLRPHVPALMLLATAFVGSTLVLILALSTLPLTLPRHITELTLSEIRGMSLSLRAYSRSSPRAAIHTLAVLGYFFTWKQSFTIPGSLIMNVVFGAMYGTLWGTLYTSALTSLGGVFCYLVMAPLGPLIASMPGLHKPLNKMRGALGSAVDGSSSSSYLFASSRATALARQPGSMRRRRRRRRNQSPSVSRRPSTTAAATSSSPYRQTHPTRQSSLQTKMANHGRSRSSVSSNNNGNIWSYLLILRVLPIVPYGLMNIACAVLRVPLLPYAATLLVGSIPWNACTVQVGDLLVDVVEAAIGSSGTGVQYADSLDVGGFHDAAAPNARIAIAAVAAPAAAAATVAEGGGARAIAAKVWSKEMMVKLLLMSIVSLAPMLLQRYLKQRRSQQSQDETVGEEGSDVDEEENYEDGEDLEEDGGDLEEDDDEEDEEELDMVMRRTTSPATMMSNAIGSWITSSFVPSSAKTTLSDSPPLPSHPTVLYSDDDASHEQESKGRRLSMAWFDGSTIPDRARTPSNQQTTAATAPAALARSGEWIIPPAPAQSPSPPPLRIPSIKRASIHHHQQPTQSQPSSHHQASASSVL